MLKNFLNRNKRNKRVDLFTTTLILFMSLSFPSLAIAKEKESERDIKPDSHIQLAVPLINQMDEPRLYNGCEVSSLVMLLQYNGFDVTKNELADEITTVPFNENGVMGDPNDGFVGSVSGATGPGYSAYSPVIVELAEKEINTSFKVENLTHHPFDAILSELLNEHPVWVITTTNFSVPTELEKWKTANGTISTSWNVHSVVLTGFDSTSIYLNDPYGEKRKVDRDAFEKSWRRMGNQAVTIVPA